MKTSKMKTFSLLCLNTYDGRCSGYIDYMIRLKSAGFLDIMCLQEVSDGSRTVFNPHQRRTSSGALLDHMGVIDYITEPGYAAFAPRQQYFNSTEREYDFNKLPWGNATIINPEDEKTFGLLERRDIFLLGHMDSAEDTILDLANFPVNMIALKLICLETKVVFWVCNVHGYYAGPGVGKADTPERLTQSKRIVSFLTSINDPWILCGDFNLRPDNESLKMIEDIPNCRNLVSEYDIETTRIREVYGDEKTDKEPFADYVFTKGVDVNSFLVDVSQPISDHAPLSLMFTLESE